MDTIRNFLEADWPRVVIPLVVFAGILIAGWVAKRLVFRALDRWADRTRFEIDNLVVEAVRRPFMIWILILALYLAADASTLPERATFVLGKILLGLWVLSFTVVATGIARNLVRYYGRHFQGVLPVTSLTENLASLLILIISVLILLNMLGISITPMLTALGVGGLAVALALQDTLANLFAGFYISVAGQYRLGDYIKLDSGEEGYITDITWRSTTIRALQNNLIVIPNSQLAKAIVTNYHLPEKRMSVLLPVSVSYDSDPDEVERILVQEATKGVPEIPGLLAEPQPFVRFIPGFGDSSLNFTLICQAREFVDQYVVQHELRKRIFRRFRETGIEIPFPIRTVYLRDHTGAPCGTHREGAAKASAPGPS
jgi:small-conductance mechanosensitive channel